MHLNLVLQILSNSMISKPVIGQFMLDWKNRHFGMDQSQFINSLTLPIHQISNAKVMYSNVLYPYYTDIVLMLYYLPFFSFCKYVQCNFFNNIFIFLRTIRSQGRPEKYGRVSQSNSSEGILAQLSSNNVYLDNTFQLRFISFFFCFWCSHNACSNNVLNKRFQTVRVRGFPRGFADGYWTIATVSSIKVLYRSMLAINIKII